MLSLQRGELACVTLDARSALVFGLTARDGGQSDERCRTRERSGDDMRRDVV